MVEAETSADPSHLGTVASSAISTGQNVGDLELNAINQLVTALSPLTAEQRNRALEYVLRRFDFATHEKVAPPTLAQINAISPPAPQQQAQVINSPVDVIQDIRALKETKLP